MNYYYLSDYRLPNYISIFPYRQMKLSDLKFFMENSGGLLFSQKIPTYLGYFQYILKKGKSPFLVYSHPV